MFTIWAISQNWGKKKKNCWFWPIWRTLNEKSPKFARFWNIYKFTNKLRHVAKLYKDAYFLKNFTYMLLPNLATSSYGWSPLWMHDKIGKKKEEKNGKLTDGSKGWYLGVPCLFLKTDIKTIWWISSVLKKIHHQVFFNLIFFVKIVKFYPKFQQVEGY
jgi:hypothetical protein